MGDDSRGRKATDNGAFNCGAPLRRRKATPSILTCCSEAATTAMPRPEAIRFNRDEMYGTTWPTRGPKPAAWHAAAKALLRCKASPCGLAISRAPREQLFQPPNFECAAPAQRQHAGLRRRFRSAVRGHSRRPSWCGNTSIRILAALPPTIACFAPIDAAQMTSRGREQPDRGGEVASTLFRVRNDRIKWSAHFRFTPKSDQTLRREVPGTTTRISLT